MVDDVIGVVFVGGVAVVVDETGELQPGAKLDQHVLEGPHVAVGRQDGLADRIRRPSGLPIGRSSNEMQSQRSR